LAAVAISRSTVFFPGQTGDKESKLNTLFQFH
jgi:hypothetical protein